MSTRNNMNTEHDNSEISIINEEIELKNKDASIPFYIHRISDNNNAAEDIEYNNIIEFSHEIKIDNTTTKIIEKDELLDKIKEGNKDGWEPLILPHEELEILEEEKIDGDREFIRKTYEHLNIKYDNDYFSNPENVINTIKEIRKLFTNVSRGSIRTNEETELKNFPPQTPKKAPILFSGKQREALAFLEQYYGEYLTYFGAEEDILFQYNLKELDKRLYTGLKAWLQYEKKQGRKVPKFADIVPPKSRETDIILQNTSKRITSLSNTLNQRRHRNKEKTL